MDRAALWLRLALPGARRAALHGAVAASLERRHAAALDARASALAHHHLEAGDAGRAVAWAVRAGEQARQRMAFEDAALLFERVLGAVEEAAAGPDSEA